MKKDWGDDVNPKNKLLMYSHKIDWIERLPVPRPEEAEPISVEQKEPLKSECKHFIEFITSRKTPKTDGNSGLRVLKISGAWQESLKKNGEVYRLTEEKGNKYFAHESSFIDDGVEIVANTASMSLVFGGLIIKNHIGYKNRIFNFRWSKKIVDVS